jgi:hypothetical protein
MPIAQPDERGLDPAGAAHPDKAAADGFGRLFPWIGLSGPAYTCGFTGPAQHQRAAGHLAHAGARAAVEPQCKVEC